MLRAVSRAARNCQAAPQVRPTTDAAGEAVFTLPVGDYRFRADKGGSQYWSGDENHCTLPGCGAVTVTVPAGAAAAPGYPDGGPRLVFLASDPAVALLATLPLAAMGVLRNRRKKWLVVDEGRRTWAETAVLVVALGVGLVGVGMALAAPSQIAVAQEVPPVVTRTIDYTYDPLYRLTDATYSTGEQYTYTYDAAGNRLSYSGPDGAHTYAYDAADRLTSVDGVAYTYDNNGNLLSDGARSFTYDSGNRLTQVVAPTEGGHGTLTTQYGYSGDGVRVVQTVNGVTTRYVNDVVAALPQVLQENRGGVAPTQVAYLYGQGMVAQQGSGTWAYQHPDALGSVRQLTDADGNVTQARFYTPFGAPESGVGDPDAGSFGYAGEQEDPASGLTYLRARYYDPTVGRFLTRDPYPAYASMPSTLHRYAYVGNNPINRVDPSGLKWAVPRAQQLRRNPLEMAGLARVRAMSESARSAGRIGGPARAASLSYRPGMAGGGGLSRAGFGGYRTSGVRMLPKPNAPPYDATQAARRHRDAANAITADAQRRGLGKRPSDCALDWYEAQQEKQRASDAMAEGYGSMTASERKRARKALQEAFEAIDQQWVQHLAGYQRASAGLPGFLDHLEEVILGPMRRLVPPQWQERLQAEVDRFVPPQMRERLRESLDTNPFLSELEDRGKIALATLNPQRGLEEARGFLQDLRGESAVIDALFGVPQAMKDTAAWVMPRVINRLESKEGAIAAMVLVGAIVVVTGGAAIAAFGPGMVLGMAAAGAATGAVSGVIGAAIQAKFDGKKPDYLRAAVAGAASGAIAGVVSLGAGALGVGAVGAGALTGISTGAVQKLTENLMTPGKEWYEGVGLSAAIGGIGGAAAGGIMGAVQPENLLDRVLVGGFTGGVVTSGVRVAFNVAAGRPWYEGVGEAFAVGATTGAVDAFTDWFGDAIVEDMSNPRPRPRTADEGGEWAYKGDDDNLDLPPDAAYQRTSGSERPFPAPELLGLPSRDKAQGLIDDIVRTEFANVELTHYPKYSPGMDIEDPGKFSKAVRGTSSEIAPRAIEAGRRETVDSIAHEEMHHRIWDNPRRAEWLQSKGITHEQWAKRIAERYTRMKLSGGDRGIGGGGPRRPVTSGQEHPVGVVKFLWDRDARAFDTFIQKSEARTDMISLAPEWKMMHQGAEELPSFRESLSENLFVYYDSGETVGAMKVYSREKTGRLVIADLETIRSGMGIGTTLMKAAVIESQARGFEGRLVLYAKPQAESFYMKLGGEISNPVTNEFRFDEQAAQDLLRR